MFFLAISGMELLALRTGHSHVKCDQITGNMYAAYPCDGDGGDTILTVLQLICLRYDPYQDFAQSIRHNEGYTQ